MIKKEEIKEGLEFVLHYSDFKDEEDEKQYLSRLVWYGFKVVCHSKNVFYTKIQFDGYERTLVTAKRPVFEVVKFENDSVFVKNKNASMIDDVFMFIDISFVEKFGYKVVKKQKIKRMNKERREMYDVPYLFTNSIRLDSGSNKEDADRFKEITDKMFETFKAKNHDYGSSFSNLFKECGMTYAYGHMAEKLERVKSLMKDDAKVKGEGMKDSLLDLANYAILTVIEIEKNEKEQKE